MSRGQRYRVRRRRGHWQVIDWSDDETVIAEHLVRWSARAHATELNTTSGSMSEPSKIARSSPCT